ncbi:MAG: substrate-binding domain-containing protein [Spirochaetaceae bacterium]|nr:MAG: substrate-binding domain-containing protein [Spirochaetaceae bacterium]
MGLLVTVAAFAGGKADTTAKGDVIRIGLSFGTLQQERWTKERKMMEAWAEEHGGVELIVQAADSDATKQASQCENLLAQGVDVLIVVPQDAEAAGVIVEKAHEVDVPVIAYDRMINKVDLDVYVSFDSIRVGEYMAEYLVRKHPKGNYVVLKGGPTDNNAHLVYEGNMNVLQKHVDSGAIKIVADQWCNNWSPEEALKHTENALTANDNNIQGIITGWDGLALAAVQALAAQGLAGKVGVTGQDADLSACQRIVEGTQTMTVYKPLRLLAKAGMETAVALAKGEEPDITGTVNNGFKDVPSVLPPIYPVDETNMVEAVINDGFHTMEDVYKNVPKDKWPK